MKLGLVIPWFGRELKGGAEQQAWQIASRLAARHHQVTVLTTCCRSHQDDWSVNHHPAGISSEPEGFAVHRFPVEARDRPAFEKVAAKLQAFSPEMLKPGVSPVTLEEAETFVRELIRSPELVTYLKGDHEHDRFILMPYLYGPIIDGTKVLGKRAALQPCLHNEAYAYLPQIAEAFHSAGHILFNSEGELELAIRLFGPGIFAKSHLVGEGLEEFSTEQAPEGGAIASVKPPAKFVLYLGRKDRGKNVDLLLRAFARFRHVRPSSNLNLVLAGHGSLHEPLPPATIDLGLVSESDKGNLLSNCVALLQPSVNESFSRVIMEGWLHGRPVAANTRCLPTAVAVEKAHGGWTAATESEWAELLVAIDRLSPTELDLLGANGRRYAEANCDWEGVIDRYEQVLGVVEERPATRNVAVSENLRIHQFLPNLSFGDAVSNHALQLRDELVGRGVDSQIFAKYVDPRIIEECKSFTDEALRSLDALVYHHSVGTDLVEHLLNHRGPKCLVYHNITPAEFFDEYRPDFAGVLRQGRKQLQRLTTEFELAFGVSAFNQRELRDVGFKSPGILPIKVDPAEWAFAADPRLMERMQDGRTNILFVGRIVPNKRQDNLVRAFAQYLAFDPTARLTLAGTIEADDPYAVELQNDIYNRGLQSAVTLTGRLSPAELSALYRSAHLFWSMSEHEGFGVPLIEAMWHDIPVLAFASSGIPETLGPAAVMFDDKTNLRELAALAYLLTHDASLRQKVIAAQRQHRASYLPAHVSRVVDRALGAIQDLALKHRSVGDSDSAVRVLQTPRVRTHPAMTGAK